MSSVNAADGGWESPATIPLVVGVTGHRDPHPDAIASMREAFLATLDRLSDELPHTPIVVLSGLATGADQLAVRWACEWAGSRPRLGDGARLRCVGVLPLLRNDYLRDFGQGEERDDFESAVRRCSYVFALPKPEDPPAEAQDDRNDRYRDLGLFIARQADVLVAFWDGKAKQARGGTSDVVNFCTAGALWPIDHALWDRFAGSFQAPADLLIGEERVPVVHIPTSRRSGGTPASDIANGVSVDGISLVGDGWEFLRRLMDRELVNRELAGSRWKPEGRDQSCPSCLDGDQRWDRFQERRRCLSGAAMAMRRRLGARELVTCFLFALGIASFQVFSSIFDDLDGPRGHDFARVALMLGYVGLLVVGLFLLKRSQQRRMDFVQATIRAVAECMRLQAAILRAGVWDEQVGNWMTARTCQGTEPLRSMLKSSCLEAIALARDRDVRALLGGGDRGLDEAKSGWIEEQLSYFKGQLGGASRRSRRVRRFRRWKHGIAIFVFSVAVALLLLSIKPLISWPWLEERLPKIGGLIDWGSLLVGLSLAWFAFIEMAESTEQTSTELKEFRRMQAIYDVAQRKIESAPSREKIEEVVRDLGKEAIAEVAEWYIRNRERAVETKVG